MKNRFARVSRRRSAFIALCLMGAVETAATAELDCLIRPEAYIELSSPVDTTLKKLYVDVGDEVTRGKWLVQLENSVQKARVELAETEAASSTAIESRRVQLAYAKRNQSRIEDLYSKQGVPLFEKEKAETEVQLAEIELQRAEEQKRIAELSLERARSELKLRTIKSPINGIVVDIYANAGESVAEKTLMKLAQINPLRVETIVPAEYFGRIQEGMEVQITPEFSADRHLTAVVSSVDQLIDPASGSFTVRMELPNESDELVPGLNCIARFPFDTPMFGQR